MTRPFDDATRWNIAALCAAFVRLPESEPAPALKRAAVAITLVDAGDGSSRTALLLTLRAAALHAHRGAWALPGGRCDKAETQAAAARADLPHEPGHEGASAERL